MLVELNNGERTFKPDCTPPFDLSPNFITRKKTTANCLEDGDNGGKGG